MKINFITILALFGLLASSKVTKVNEFCRHGARQPGHIFNFTENPADNFDHDSRLTALGMR